MHSGPGVSPAHQQQGLASPGLLQKRDLAQKGGKMLVPKETRCPPPLPHFIPGLRKSLNLTPGSSDQTLHSGVLDHSPLRNDTPPNVNKGNKKSPRPRSGAANSKGQTLCSRHQTLHSRFGNTKHPRESQPGYSQNPFGWLLKPQPRRGRI